MKSIFNLSIFKKSESVTGNKYVQTPFQFRLNIILSVLLMMFSMSAWGVSQSFAFATIGSTGWTSSYADHTVTIGTDATVYMNASKQTSTITTVPVTKGQPVSLVLLDNTKSISSVTFTCSKWGSKAQTITLKYSTDGGSSYSTLSPSVTSTNFSISSSSLPTGTNAVQITFSSQSNQVGINSVEFTYASAPSYTITAISNNNTWGTVSLSGSVITASPNSGYQISDATSYTVTAGTATVERGTGANSNKFTVNPSSDCTVRINFEPLPTYPIRFFNNGTQVGETQNLYVGATATKPADPAACDEGYSFVGWWTDELAEDNTTAETWITDFTVSSAQDYYAVFSHNEGGTGNEYSKTPSGSSDLVDGGGGTSYVLTIATGVTVTISGWTNNKPVYHSDGQWRIYGGSQVVFESANGNITKIVFTSTQNNLSTTQGTYSEQTWTGDATSVNFTNSATQSRITGITVTIGNPGTTYYTTDCGSACSTPTLVFDVTEVTKFDGDASFIKTATLSNNPLGGTITYSSSLPSKAEVNATTGEVTIHEAMSSTPVVITATVDKVTSGIECQKKVTASYTLNIYNRVTWSVNGVSYTEGDPTQQAVEGGTITAYPTNPDGSSACGGKVFVGWTNAPYAESDAAPDPLYTSLGSMSDVHITENTTFYAVFAEVGGESENQYKKVTSPASEMTTGKRVLIVHHSTSKALSSTESGIGYQGKDVTINDNRITTTDATIIWTVQTGSTGYALKQDDNYMLAAESSEGNHYLYFDEEVDEWTLTGSGPYVLASSHDPGYYMEYHNNLFKSYTGGSGTYFEMDFYVPDIGYTAYSTTCGPNIKAGEVERLTSTKDQAVKSQAITVKGSSLDGSTLSATITGTNASLFACSLAATTITAGSIETTYTIRYTPNTFGDAQHTATLTFTDGTTDSDPITLHGRSLPEHFAIVAFDGANYYALDGTMSGEANTVKPFPVTVSAGSVDLCPTQAIYYLTELEEPDQNVHLVGPSGRLYGAGSGTGLNTKSLSSTSGTGWLLTTEDFNTYHITNATTTDRGVMYNDANNVFGHYKTTNYGTSHYFGDIRLLPITNECTCLPAPIPAVVARATTATINWDAVPGAVSYAVTCSGGEAPVIDGCKATITGLANNKEYTFTIKAIASGYDCSLSYNGSFTTTNCDDVPYNIVTTPGIKSVIVKWSMDAATAKICIYSDEACTTPVGSAHSGLTSPATIIGLEENTQYYLKIFAGAGENCESSVVPFLTQTTTVEIAEWATDHINIVLNADAATATVEIDNKREHGSATSMVATDIFFSKYFEASGFTKLVGLYNGTDHDIDISDLIIKAGTTSWTTTKGANNYVAVGDISKLNYEYGDGAGHIMLPKNTEIILYSLKDDNKAGFSGEGCLDQFYDWDDLANNLVPNWYRIGKTNTSGSTVDADGHNTLNFSGPHSVSLWRSTTMIDIIGAGNSSSPTDISTIEVKTLHALGNGRTINCPNDKPGWFVEDGWSPIPQEGDPDYEGYPEGYSTYLTTNRCLLIRANHVTNGDSAVLNNTATFKTLGEGNREYDGVDGKKHKAEWVGIPIGNDGSSAERDCLSGAQFGYVGQYDYSDYYVKYDSIGELKELDGKRNDDGTYTIPIPKLDTMSCTMLKVKVYEGTTEKASREYKVPIMIDVATTTAADKYFHSYAREANSADVCKDCDVVILSTGTLTKASSDDTKDIPEIRNLTIYPGGTLVVPEGAEYEYTVNSILFRVQGEQTPVAKLKGDLISNDGQVIVSRRINNDRYVFFSLPYDCNVSDIRWSNGEIPERGTDYQIVEYDSETRAAEGSTKGAPGHWKPAGDILKAGVGYNVAVSSKALKELIFPMAIPSSNNLTTAENTKSNTVPLYKHESFSTSKNNHNWNLVAHPYVSPFEAYSGGIITAGWLRCVTPATSDKQGVWEYVDGENVYLTIPSFSENLITYDQTLSTGITQLDPFLAVFVQAVTDGDITFAQAGRKLSAPARHLAAKAEDEDESIFVGVTLSGNGQSDKTSVRIRPDFTDDYQLGYDLQKFTTFYTSRPQIYMKPADLQLAFQAVNDDVAKNTWMPMGVYCYEAGTFTFSLYENYPTDEVEAVYLKDNDTGTITNLLYDTYTITTTKQLYTNTRFSLNVIVNRRAPQVITDIPITDAPDNIVRKLLINGHVYIQRGGQLYDITGKQVLKN